MEPSLPHCRQILHHLSHEGSPDRQEFEQTLGDSEEESGVLQSTGSQRVGHDLATEYNKANFLLPSNPPFLLYIKFFI